MSLAEELALEDGTSLHGTTLGSQTADGRHEMAKRETASGSSGATNPARARVDKIWQAAGQSQMIQQMPNQPWAMSTKQQQNQQYAVECGPTGVMSTEEQNHTGQELGTGLP